jgi:hypothetical protein
MDDRLQYLLFFVILQRIINRRHPLKIPTSGLPEQQQLGHTQDALEELIEQAQDRWLYLLQDSIDSPRKSPTKLRHLYFDFLESLTNKTPILFTLFTLIWCNHYHRI